MPTKETVTLEVGVNLSKDSANELEESFAEIWEKGMSIGMHDAIDSLKKSTDALKAKYKGFQIFEDNKVAKEKLRDAFTFYKQVQNQMTAQEKKFHLEKMANLRAQVNANSQATRNALANLRSQKMEELKTSMAQKTEESRERQRTETFDAFRTGGLGSLVTKMFKDASPSAIFEKSYKKLREKASFFDEDIKNQKNKLQEMRSKEGFSENDAAYKVEQEHLKELQKQKGKYSKQAAVIGAVQGTLNTFKNLASSVFKTLGLDLKSIFSDVGKSIKDILDPYTGVASYDTTTSLFTNAKARNQQMQYGLSSESNFALTKTKEMLGMTDDNDLMYMNENQKQAFNEIMEKYKTWYSGLESTGAMERLQNAQLEFKMFKEELSYKFLGWFAEHKDQIFNAIEFIMNVVFRIAEVVMNILDALPFTKGMSSSLASSDASLTNNYSNKNVNINVNTTNNATANLQNKSELDNFFEGTTENTVRGIAQALNSL